MHLPGEDPPTPQLWHFQRVVRGLATEAAERNAVQRALDAAGHRRLCTAERGKLADGRTVRVHLWRDVWPGGVALALVAGPDVKGTVLQLFPHVAGQPAGGIYVPASGRQPALTDTAPRRNPADGGRSRETAGTTSSIGQLQKAVSDARSEQAQVNLVARVLAGQGYAAAGKPEVHATTVDRSTFRIYLWRDTPFGDHLVLSTGPSFEPKVALASQIPAEPGVGFYVKALVDKSPRTLAGAGRAAARAMPKPTPAAEVAAERVARKVRAPKAQVLAAAAQVAEAEGSPTVTVAHVEEASEYAAERAQADQPPLTATERLRHPAERAPVVDESAAMQEAADFIKALRAMRKNPRNIRANGIRFRPGESEFIHAAARVVTDAHLTHGGKRVFAVADYGPGEALLFTTNRAGRIGAPERGEPVIGRMVQGPGGKFDIDAPSEALWEGIVAVLSSAGAFS